MCFWVPLNECTFYVVVVFVNIFFHNKYFGCCVIGDRDCKCVCVPHVLFAGDV